MRKIRIISNLMYSIERSLRWCPKPPATKAQSAIYHKDDGQRLRRWRLRIFGKPDVKTMTLTLFLMLILIGAPTLFNYLFFNSFNPPNPDLFPFYSFEVIPVEPSDYTTTVENGNFRTQEDWFTIRIFENGSFIPNEYPPFFTTKVEVKTKPFHLDASQIVRVNYYWLSMDKNGFPFGDYYARLEYQDESTNRTFSELHSQLIHAEGISQIKENEFEYPFPSPATSPGSGFPLPKASQNEYVFKLVAYTNATVNPDEPIARFVLAYKYKSSVTIMGYRINLETIGYIALLLPFALLATALLFQTMKRKHNRFHSSTDITN